MKQIKTIVDRLNNANDFDIVVNAAIQGGWVLTVRKVLLPQSQPNNGSTFTHIMLYAELEKEIITDADRCCENCKHFDCPPDADPCNVCSDNCSHWEPVEGET